MYTVTSDIIFQNTICASENLITLGTFLPNCVHDVTCTYKRILLDETYIFFNKLSSMKGGMKEELMKQTQEPKKVNFKYLIIRESYKTG